MPSDLSSYLATHYLAADPKPAKKRKRKQPQSSAAASGLLIADDDETGWTKPSNADDDEDPEIPTTVAGTSAEFRRAKKSAWKTVGDGGAPESKKDEAADADAILASAAAESAAAAGRTEADEAPAVVGDADGDVRMSDGTFAGLQSAKAISAQLARRRAEEIAELDAIEKERRSKKKKKKQKDGDEEVEEDQVILRDATGRRVDVAMRKAEARRAAADAEENARKEEDAKRRALKGDVQLEEARRRREALEDAALMPLARGKDDEDLNAAMKATRRWNDPMAQFMGGDDEAPAVPGRSGKKGGKNSRRPVYKQAAPPNRCGIRPGYRWDGVDRSNGFEAERFKALNRRERNKGLEYSWQMDE